MEWEDEQKIDERSLLKPTSSGCLVILASAVVSCILLFLNGGLVMALINVFADRDLPYAQDGRISQFIVLIGPVLLLIVQWMMIDYVRVRVGRTK